MQGWKTTLKLICQWTNMSQRSDQASNFNRRQLFKVFITWSLNLTSIAKEVVAHSS